MQHIFCLQTCRLSTILNGIRVITQSGLSALMGSFMVFSMYSPLP